jgi:CheY-like chemotaxis protein
VERVRTALIVDDSKLVTAVMEATLRPHCHGVIVANSVGDAKQKIAQLGPDDLVLTDIFMGDGEGFELLELVKNKKDKPAIIVCSSRATPQNQQRAMDLGALAFLAKPLSAQAVLLMWGKHQRGPAIVDRAPRVRLFAHVFVSGEGESALAYEVHDLSRTGAFLVTHGPLPIGQRFELTIVVRDLKVALVAVVARVQEPAWIHVGGVGVAFEKVDDKKAAVLEEMVNRYGYKTER